MVFFVVFFNTFEGTRSADRGQIAAARLLGATEITVLRTVVIPSAWVLASLTHRRRAGARQARWQPQFAQT